MILINDWNPQTITIPVYGQISAGKPLESSTTITWRKIRIPRGHKIADQIFAVIVTGESLRDDGITSGDIAICRRNHIVHNGKLAAVLVEGGMTLKYFYQDPDGTVWLEGAHPNHPAKAYRPEDVQVQAQVIRIERDL